MEKDEIEVRPLFEGRLHERHEFAVDIEGAEYKGHFHDGEIQWLHPQPHNTVNEDRLESVESDIQDYFENELEK